MMTTSYFTERLGLAGPSGGPLLQPPARAGPPTGLQRGRHRGISGQLVPVLCHSHSLKKKKVFPDVQRELCFNLCPCLSTLQAF